MKNLLIFLGLKKGEISQQDSDKASKRLYRITMFILVVIILLIWAA